MRWFVSENSGAAAPRHRAAGWAVIAVTAALLAAATPELIRLGGDVHLLPPDDPYVRLDAEITAEFGMPHPVVWVLEARDGTVWTAPLLARLQALTRDVFTIPGVIADDVIGLASPNLRDLRVTEDTLEPVYLMAAPPETPQAITTLRRRVDSDPNFGGSLVSMDGRAAMVVANFRSDADPQRIAAAALALRSRYSDRAAAVYVTGAPVLGALVGRAALPLAAAVLAILCAGLLALAVTVGWHGTLRVGAAAGLAVLWTAAGLGIGHAAELPWSAYAVLPITLTAAAVVITADQNWRRRIDVLVALGMGWVALAVLVGAPAAAFGIAGAVGTAAAVAAGLTVHALAPGHFAPRRHPVGAWLGALALVGLALPGTLRLQTSLGLTGYGARYLPAGVAADLRVLTQHFPPPTALALRVRGAPGFVASPAVLQAIDAVAGAAREDAAVVRVLSLADIVKMVHRAFNDDSDQFFAIPAQDGLIARYLALAYSPGFRRFVDRAFTRSAVWVYLSSDRATDLGRVLRVVSDQLARHPVPNARTDMVGGDGAVVLVSARCVRALLIGVVVLALMVGAGVAVLCGTRAGAAALVGGVAAAVTAAGVFGWAGVPLDLVSLPALIAATATGAAFAVLGGAATLAPALGVIAAMGLAASALGASQLGTVLGAALAAPILSAAIAEPLWGDRRSRQAAAQDR